MSAEKGRVLSRSPTRAAPAKRELRPRVDGDEIEAAICERIRAAICNGELPPGTKLPEEAIAESFATKRFFVRAAFQRLAFENLIDLQKNRGAFVARPSVKEARDTFEARRVIERVTTEIATRTARTHHLRAIAQQIDDQEPHWKRGSRKQAIAGIGMIHMSLASLAHNGALAAALERLILRTSLILGLYGTAHTFDVMPNQYRDLMDIIQSGRSLDAARQIERCLFVLESELDFYPPVRREVDLRRLMETVG